MPERLQVIYNRFFLLFRRILTRGTCKMETQPDDFWEQLSKPDVPGLQSGHSTTLSSTSSGADPACVYDPLRDT